MRVSRSNGPARSRARDAKIRKGAAKFRLLATAVLLLLSRGAVAEDSLPSAAVMRPNDTAGVPISRARDLPAFGPSTNFQRVGLAAFTPADSSMTYSDASLTSLTWSRYPTNGNAFGTFVAAVDLPSGALLDNVEFDVCDTSAANNVVATIQVTSYTGENATVAAGGDSSGLQVGCHGFVVSPSSPIQIENFGSQVLLVVNLPTHDGTTSISGAILYYHLQVSPASGIATFSDVPASDFGYQFIEALARSGITGGCGGTNYCPDSPVTRRQMAIFLAKALGLSFP